MHRVGIVKLNQAFSKSFPERKGKATCYDRCFQWGIVRVSLEPQDAEKSAPPLLVRSLLGGSRVGAVSHELRPSFISNLLRETSSESSAFEANFAAEGAPTTIWEECLFVLLDDFLARKEEVLLLNPGRRSQIEAHVAALADSESSPAPLERVLAARPESREHAGFRAFAFEAAAFQLFQFLLFKRWIDLRQVAPEALDDAAHKLSWQISNHLKSRQPNRVIGRSPWAFLKINIYSWYKPSAAAWSALLRATAKTSLADEPEDFLGTILSEAASPDVSAGLPLAMPALYAKLAWEVLLQQKCSDDGVESIKSLSLGKSSASTVFVLGSAGGQALTALRSLSDCFSLDGVFAFARSEIELFLSEICLLWALSKDLRPAATLLPSSRLATTPPARSERNVFPIEEVKVPGDAAHAIAFPDACEPGRELVDALSTLPRLRENGALLVVSEEFWVTDKSALAQQMREQCLGSASLRLVVDLRHLTLAPGVRVPRCCFLLEKHTSKEMRDGNRPKIIKVRGHAADPAALEEVWQLVLDCIPIKDNPGEVKMFQLGSGKDRVRIEVMSAATTQAHLGTSPWTSLSEPAFYQVSSKLKLHPYKLHQEGFLLRPQKSTGMPLKKGVHFLEIPGVGLYAEADGAEASLAKSAVAHANPKALSHFFLPEMTLKESPAFFAAMINSSPIQFWYRLEWEQHTFGGGRRSGARPSDSILKLMPLARALPPSSLLPAEAVRGCVLPSLEIADAKARRLCGRSEPDLSVSIELHKLVLDLEATVDYHLAITREYAKHLFPALETWRWCVPDELPEISAEHALATLQHLQHAPLRQHPSIQCTHLKNVSDFKVTDLRLHLGGAGVSELILYSGSEAMMRVHGPTLLMQAAASLAQKRLQRPWTEISLKITFPIDTSLMLKQLEEFVRLTRTEAEAAARAARISDFVFCRLFDLAAESPNCGDALIIRNHVNPGSATVRLGGDRSKHLFTKPRPSPAAESEESTALR